MTDSCEEAQIDIEGVIGTPEQLQFSGTDERVATYARFAASLAAVKSLAAPRIVVNIRSTGGDVNDALLIHDALKESGATVITRCYGYVASAATIIAQAASEGCREISPRALYLIHCSESAAEGNSRTLSAAKELLDLNVSAIAYKTDCWNISRLDNSFQLSGVMLLDGGVDNEQQAEELVRRAERKFAGKPGQVMFMIKDCGEGDGSRYIPIASTNEGDWKDLHEQATSDIVVAHSWFRSLSGLDYASGFNAERILHEYEVALNTVILSEQAELLNPLKGIMERVLGEDCSSLAIVNRPPTRTKPLYMKVWEARQADGLDYDPDNELEQLFVAQITKYAMRNID